MDVAANKRAEEIMLQNTAVKPQKSGQCLQLPAGRFKADFVKQFMYDGLDIRGILGKVGDDDSLLFADLFQNIPNRGYLKQEGCKIKIQTFVFAMVSKAAMEATFCDITHITGGNFVNNTIHRQLEIPGTDKKQFCLFVPVKGHVVIRRMLI